MEQKHNNLRNSNNRIMLVGAIAPTLSGSVSSGCLPFGAMALSAYLKQKGVQCKVISTAFPNAVEEIYRNLDNIDLLGISSMSGPYLKYAILAAQNVKRLRPNLPIVWGGPHASLMDEDLIVRDFADFVIRGVGEKALLKLIKVLKGEGSFSSVPGLTWTENGSIKRNELDANFNIDEFPQLDYSFIPDKYSHFLKDEFSYFSSRGCPFDCSYCVATQIYNRRWYNKSEDKIISELKRAYHRYRFKSIFFWDDNLFVNIARLCNILSRLNHLNIRFRWSGFCRADIFSKLDDKVICQLKKRGLHWVSIGAESGSQRILDRLNKQITLDNIKQTVNKFKKWGIGADFSFMGGIPGETTDDFYKTVRLIKWIKRKYPSAGVRVFRFIPYPKMPILNQNREITKLLPKDVHGWCNVTYQNRKFPWVPKKINRALAVLTPASLYSQKPADISLVNLAVFFLYYITQLRIKTNFFFLPLEGVVAEKMYRMATQRVLNNFVKEINELS